MARFQAIRATAFGVSLLAAILLTALAGCGSSTPGYCTDRTNLENSIKKLPSLATSGDINGLKSQVTTIKNDATTLVNSAKSDFPTETAAMKSSVDALETAVKALPSNPSATQVTTIAADAASTVSAVNGFVSASKSKCS